MENAGVISSVISQLISLYVTPVIYLALESHHEADATKTVPGKAPAPAGAA
jgi:hypothetical protein